VSGVLIILSAPSGTGKTTIARALVDLRDDMMFSISATTRAPRGQEVDGKDYYFLDRETFEARVQERGFLEWAEYGGNLYGTLHSEVDRIMRNGHHVVLDIEIQGARHVRTHTQNVVSIFILPPDGETLVQRLEGRRAEERAVRALRLRTAVEEIGDAVEYDYIVTNDEIDRTVAEVAAIVDTEVRRPERLPDVEQSLNSLRDVLTEHAARLEAEEE
jgi:guanylate kinase